MSAEKPRLELWVRFAFGVMILTGFLVLYMGARPGGRGPILVYNWGPRILGPLALLTFAVGFGWSAFHRPLLRRGRLPALAGLALLVVGAGAHLPYPSSHEGKPSAVAFQLPVEGTWTVRWGGEGPGVNLLAPLPDRRWGLVLVVEQDGSTYTGDGRAPENYHAYGGPVLAPAAGRVVRVVDDLPDRPPGERARGEALGNYVVLEVAPGEFAFLAGLQPGSVQVAVGDTVEARQRLARVGSSAASWLTPEPHLALHLQDTPEPYWGEAIPLSLIHI